MDFAKKQLEKYGWAEGKGLGKDENGIQTALKPKLKRGTGGIGHDMAKEFTNDWWNKVYNNASNNVEVIIADDADSSQSVIKKSKKRKRKLPKEDEKKPLYFTNFIKTATLTNGKIENLDDIIGDNSISKDSASSEDESDKKIKKLTDEELFEACGGRTAHKGARHGLKSNGKLSRIQQQEKMFIDNYNKLKNSKTEIDLPLDNKLKIKNKISKSSKCKIKNLE